jgi:hypothetical protein
MAQLDGSAPFKRQIQTVTLENGDAETLTMVLVDTIMTTTETGRASVSLKPRGRRPSNGPIVMETDDGEIQMSCTFMVISRYGNTALTPYEFMTYSGGASAKTTTSTVAGSRKLFKMTVVDNSTEDAGGAQTRVYAYVETQSLTEAEGEGGIMVLNWSGIDHENRPTIT